MKSKLIIICAMVAVSLGLFACYPATKQVSIEVSCDDFTKIQNITKDVEVAVGDSFKIALCSNRTTGFQWSESAQISDQTILQQTDYEFVAPEAEGIVGAAGKEVWTFQALNEGTAKIALDYSRPWEVGEKGTWSFNLVVTVK